MHDMAVCIDHNILIVSVLDLKDVLGQGVRGQRVAEILLGFLKSLALDLAFPVVDHEVVEEGGTVYALVDLVD